MPPVAHAPPANVDSQHDHRQHDQSQSQTQTPSPPKRYSTVGKFKRRLSIASEAHYSRRRDAAERTHFYSFVRRLFRLCSLAFYARVQVRGRESMPSAGEPTILCFNHGNSLGDSVILISAVRRMVRFCAKDTLWHIPFVGHLIRATGAVALYRSKEHGSEKSKESNKQQFRAVHDALLAGSCVGFAPEGRSDLVPFVGALKKGPAFMALDALAKAYGLDDDGKPLVTKEQKEEEEEEGESVLRQGVVESDNTNDANRPVDESGNDISGTPGSENVLCNGSMEAYTTPELRRRRVAAAASENETQQRRPRTTSNSSSVRSDGLKPGTPGSGMNKQGRPFVIKLVSVGLQYTHREKFRSNCMVQFTNAPIVLDKSFVDGSRFPTRREAVDHVTEALQNQMHQVTLNSPEWTTIELAIHATRIHQPLGTLMTLAEYLDLLRGWIEVLKAPVLERIQTQQEALSNAVSSPPSSTQPSVNDELDIEQKSVDGDTTDASLPPSPPPSAQDILNQAVASVISPEDDCGAELPQHLIDYRMRGLSPKTLDKITELRSRLKMYLWLLRENGVQDERVRRAGLPGGRLSTWRLASRVIVHAFELVCLGSFALPGILLWLPVWFLVVRQERRLRSRGHFWLDTVAESKMIISFFAIVGYLLLFNVFAPLLLGYSWLAVRAYEDAVAAARSIRSLYCLHVMPDHTLEALIECRARARELIEEATYVLPASSSEVSLRLVQLKLAEKSRLAWSSLWFPLHRNNKTYTETLRLSEYVTMDYFS